MTFFRQSLTVILIVTATAFAGLAMTLARPKPIDSAVLGSTWQCRQIAFVITSCAQRMRDEATPAVDTSRKEALRAA